MITIHISKFGDVNSTYISKFGEKMEYGWRWFLGVKIFIYGDEVKNEHGCSC